MSNLFDALSASEDHRSDIQELRGRIPLLQRFSDLEIERLYDRYSDSYCAGWLILDDRSIDDFASWLEN
jgi:hypothetical protein